MEIIYCVIASAVGFVMIKIAWYAICILTLPDSNDVIHKHPDDPNTPN